MAARLEALSAKQCTALTWWHPESPHHHRDAIICDGAVRSGKTLCLSLSFVFWAMGRFDGECFGLCGKTIGAARRNIVAPLLGLLPELGFSCRERISHSQLLVERGGRRNRFQIFGGRDEAAASLIQGVTLAGVLFDEVALMPRSFVEQGLARCSVEGSRFWFSCNPAHPGHWFHTEWISAREEKNALYLHFRMEDNPSLPPRILERYRALYTGVFYERYILGKWVGVQGAVYPMFDRRLHVVESVPPCSRYVLSCDYGTVNPASFGLWGEAAGLWYRVAEFYHDSRVQGIQLTDEEYCDALETLAGDRPVEAVVVDPSAASFVQCLRRRGRFPVVPADNRVLDGIRRVAVALKEGRLRFHSGCGDILREFALYRWNPGRAEDAPLKENDHAMDDLRYFVQYALGGDGEAFFAACVPRSAGSIDNRGGNP